jgi:predicted PurR-regulated permease PerM
VEYRTEVAYMFERLTVIWDSFFRGQITLMVIMGTAVWLGLTILGLPGAFALGIIAGLLEIIPNLGPFFAAIPAVIVALLQGSDHFAINNFVFALIIIGFYVLIQFIENSILVPRIMGVSVKLHPVVVILGVLVGASVWGILGALLAAPVIATGREILRYLYYRVIGENPYPLKNHSPPEGIKVSLRKPLDEMGSEAQHISAQESEAYLSQGEYPVPEQDEREMGREQE